MSSRRPCLIAAISDQLNHQRQERAARERRA